MNRFAILGSIGLLLVLAFGAGYVTRSLQTQSSPITDGAWLFSGPVPVKGTDKAVSYYPEALFQGDILLPEIEAIDAKVKFIVPPTGDRLRIGVIAYITQVRVASLQKKNIPAKYLQERTEQSKAGPVTTLPLEQVTYAVQFTFDLLDKDGFKLAEATGPDQWIESGKTNTFQEVTTKPFDLDLVRRITKVRVRLRVLRCETCRDG